MRSKTHVRILGDTLTPLNVLCMLNGDPYDWTSKTPSFELEEDDGTAITEAGTITAHPTQTFTAGETYEPDYLNCNAHGCENGDQVVLATSGTLPTGLSTSTRYYVVQRLPNQFKVSRVPNGEPVDVTASTGSGAHTFYIVGTVQVTFATADIDVMMPYRLWIVSTSAAATQHFPDDEVGIQVDVRAVGN